MKYRLILIGLVVLFVVTGYFLAFKGNPIDSSSEAIKIAQKYVNEKYGQDFLDYNINATLENQIWTVSYLKKIESEIILGGGGPEVRLEQSNGKVISCLLQK